MLTPPICMSCGNMLGHVDAIYRKIREKRNKKRNDGVLPDYASVTSSTKDTNGDNNAQLMEKMGVHSDCCRMRLITSMDMSDHY